MIKTNQKTTASNDFYGVIELLEDNKGFPYYAAERRIDLFLSYYVHEILSYHLEEDIVFVAPEFPIKHKNNNQADKADLLCVLPSANQPIIVEVKTDSESFKMSQLEKYITNTKKWQDIVNGLIPLIANCRSDKRVKYFYLMQRLVDKRLAEYSKKYNSQIIKDINKLIGKKNKKDKGNRSRLIIELSHCLNATYNGRTQILYIGPDEIIKRIDSSKFSPTLKTLRFRDIKPKKKYSKELKCFINFLHTIT